MRDAELRVWYEYARFLARLVTDPAAALALRQRQERITGLLAEVRRRPVPVCILGVLDTGWGGIEANREIYDETVMCPEGVMRRVRHARMFQCQCGAFHGVVPKWVRETLRDRPGPGLRVETKWTHP